MNRHRKPSGLIDADAAGRAIAHQISAALKHRDATRREASTAKAELKITRKKFKQAKRAAKEARKLIKKLKRELRSATFAAAKDKPKKPGTKKSKRTVPETKTKRSHSKRVTRDAAAGLEQQATAAGFPVPAPIPQTPESVADTIVIATGASEPS